jgi:hypothetical protein
LYWKVIGWSFLLSAGFAIYLALCGTLLAKLYGASFAQAIGADGASRSIPVLILIGIGYLALALSYNVVLRVYLLRDVWATAASSVNIHGIEAAANVAAKGELASALGEGFADGLDVAGF